MDIFNKLKNFLGLSKSQEFPKSEDHRPWPPENDSRNSYESPFHHPGHNFNLFTDPLEIHKYFEQQMSDMLRNFGFGEFGDGFSHYFDFPQIEEIPEQEPQSGELRDQFLKPGFENSNTNKDKRDEDIDGKLDIRDWNSVFGQNQRVAPKTYFFSQSVTSRTVRNPDGTMETHHTVRDNEGNEETTITRKVDDKEYTIIKRRDKDGKEEIIENLVNLDEKDVDKIFPKQPKLPQLDERPSSFYDKFFK